MATGLSKDLGSHLQSTQRREGVTIMSIYAGLVGQALDHVPEWRSSGEVLAELLRCRALLDGDRARSTEPGWAPSALAEQLSYDVALIVLARRHNIECGPQLFEHPINERLRLERALVARGLRFDHLDDGDGSVEAEG
jgi:hypothetical protein